MWGGDKVVCLSRLFPCHFPLTSLIVGLLSSAPYVTLSLRPAQRPASERDGTEGNGE